MFSSPHPFDLLQSTWRPSVGNGLVHRHQRPHQLTIRFLKASLVLGYSWRLYRPKRGKRILLTILRKAIVRFSPMKDRMRPRMTSSRSDLTLKVPQWILHCLPGDLLGRLWGPTIIYRPGHQLGHPLRDSLKLLNESNHLHPLHSDHLQHLHALILADVQRPAALVLSKVFLGHPTCHQPQAHHSLRLQNHPWIIPNNQMYFIRLLHNLLVPLFYTRLSERILLYCHNINLHQGFQLFKCLLIPCQKTFHRHYHHWTHVLPQVSAHRADHQEDQIRQHLLVISLPIRSCPRRLR